MNLTSICKLSIVKKAGNKGCVTKTSLLAAFSVLAVMLQLALAAPARVECCRTGYQDFETRGEFGYAGYAELGVDGLPEECNYAWLLATCPFTAYNYECRDTCAGCPGPCYEFGAWMLIAQTDPGCEFTSALLGDSDGPNPLACAAIIPNVLFNAGRAVYAKCMCP